MPDLSSPYAPFLVVSYGIGIWNTYQGLFLLYKFFKGYGGRFPKTLFQNRKKGPQLTYKDFLVLPNKATRINRITLLIQIGLAFASVFILWQIVKSLP